jgi:hypothetical protein
MNRINKHFDQERRLRSLKWQSKNPPPRPPSWSYVVQHQAWQGRNFYGDLQCQMFDFKLNELNQKGE